MTDQIEGTEPVGEPQESAETPTPDEPLGDGGKKALDAERAANKELRKQLKELTEQKLEPPNAEPSDDGDLAAQLAELKAEFQAAVAAREEAEILALRTRLAAGKLPAPLITKLTGTTEDEIEAEIAEILPLLKTGPAPNPQQANPSKGRGGSIAAGRDRYQQSHSL